MLAGQAAAQVVNPSDLDVPQYYGRGKNVSVLERDRPDYQALGLHAGGFTVFPQVAIAEVYNDNVFASRTDAKADTYTSFDPIVLAKSNWGRHALYASAGLHAREYSTYHSENEAGWFARTDARVDVYGQSFLNFGGSVEKVFEERGSTNFVFTAAKPVPIHTQSVYGKAIYAQDRIRAIIDTGYQNFHYENVPAFNGTTVDESSRNFDVWRVDGRTDYALSPDTAVFGSIGYSQGHYRVGTIVGSTKDRRDFDQVRALVGANFDLTALLRGEVGVGYVKRSYKSSAFQSLSGPAIAAKFEYFPTQLLTLTATADRSPQDAAFINSGGYFRNAATLAADYELRRNIILGSAVGYEQDKFQGIDRSDRIWNVSGQARYFFNRHVGLSAQVSYADRSTSGSPVTVLGPQFNVLKFGLSLVFQL